MARPRSLPEDNSELERLLRNNTHQKIADMFGVTNQAVSKAIRDRNLNVPHRPSYKAYIPWRIQMGHEDTYVHRMLRLYGMEQSGKALTRKQAGSLAKFKTTIGPDHVVQYDPGHEKGPWLVVKRRPGIDTGYARTPDMGESA